MTDQNLVEDLLDNYIFQKARLLEAAGHRGSLDVKRMAALVRPRIEKMADVIQEWMVGPDLVMEAVFEWAKYNRHPDGPMPNMLFSSKYLMKALSFYLQVPYEIVMEKRCKTLFLERRDFEFTRMKKELEQAGVTDLVTATSYPVEVRYLMSLHRADHSAAFYMASELLALMKNDRRVTSWLAHRGVKYERVAEHFNKQKKLHT